MDKTRKVICVSSSIDNFREKLKERTGLKEWRIFDIFKPTAFFGMYHWIDYLKYILHRGKKKVFWCGGDIVNLSKRIYWQKIISRIAPKHIAYDYCENQIEQNALWKMGIVSSITPVIFTKPDTSIAFKPTKYPHVFMTAHERRENEYGIGIIKEIAKELPFIIFHIYGIKGNSKENIVYHGIVSEKQFDEEIKNYQASIRLNAFDGFAETTAKSILHGQYPITYIYYPKIDCANTIEELIELLKELRNKKEPNYEGRDYWIKELEDNLCEVLS